MRRKLFAVSTAVMGLLVAASPTVAHHGFAVEFDGSKCRDVTGTLTGVDWQNPHAYFHMDVKDADGNVASWTFEMLSVSALKRGGTVRRDFLDNVGKVANVRACPAKGSKYRAAAETLKLSDGRVRIVGMPVEAGRGGSPPGLTINP
jgi:Family of unknown function (DUF6152)